MDEPRDPASDEAPAPAGRVRFGDFELDLIRGELVRDGVFVPLEPLPTRILTILVGRRGRLVLRDELLEAGWPAGERGSERGLNTAIRQIRRALGDSARRPAYVATVPRRGYRFAAEVTDAAPAAIVRRAPIRLQPGWIAAAAFALVAALVVRVAPELDAGPRPVATAPADASDPAARLAYEMGRHLLERSPADRLRAIPHLEKAARIDPEFPEARALLAEALLLAGRIDEAEPHVEAARRLAPSLPRGEMAGGMLAMMKGRHEEADRAFRRAVAGAPSDPVPAQIHAFHLLVRGRTQEALDVMAGATELDPVSATTVGDLGYFYYYAGRYDEAVEWCNRARELDPEAIWALSCVFDAAVRGGDAPADDVARAILEARGAGPETYVDPVAGLRRFRLASATRAVAEDEPAHLWLAMALADIGRLDDAQAALREAAGEVSLGLLSVPVEPRLAPLRHTDAYRELLERLGLGA